MKRLILLRHAKAEAKDAARDIDRVLAPRGRADMKAVAAYLAAERLAADLALVSTAARTRETWALAGMPQVRTLYEARIYEALPETLLDLVRTSGGEAACVILVGHNPGLEDLAAMLVARADRSRVATLPTGSLVVLDFEVAAWSAIADGGARLDRLVTPADLGAGKSA